jgi:ABC-type proline/glycine betaine transport system permease subunit
MVIFSALVSLVFAFITKYGAWERFRYFLYLFACFVFLSIVVGFLMYPFPF